MFVDHQRKLHFRKVDPKPLMKCLKHLCTFNTGIFSVGSDSALVSVIYCFSMGNAEIQEGTFGKTVVKERVSPQNKN